MPEGVETSLRVGTWRYDDGGMAIVTDCIETPRLTVRIWRPGDAAAMGELVRRSMEHLRPYMAWIAEEPKSNSVRAELIRSWRNEWEAGTNAFYGMFADGELVGACGLHPRIGPGGLEIGYWVGVDHVRNGYATEAAAGLTSAGLAAEGIDRIEIHHDVTNAVSARVPAALGYQRGPDLESEIRAPAETGHFWTWYTTSTEWVPPFG